MYNRCDEENGIPARIYRSPKEIKNDISVIRQKIKETNSMLNIRDMLLDILVNDTQNTPERLVSELEMTLEEAKDAMSELSELHEELEELEEELSEVRWIIRR